MKIRTRILTAVLATATAFSCALTASALNPTPSITVDNNLMAATVKEADGKKTVTATLTLSSKNFEDVRGAKVKRALPKDLKVTKATIVDKNKTLIENVDYKIDGNTVTLVDVFNIGDAPKDLSFNLKLTVSGNNLNMENVPITVSGDFADTKVDVGNKIDNAGTGTLKITKEAKTFNVKAQAEAHISDILGGEGYFIPAGGVYSFNEDTKKYTYYAKKNDGTFNLDTAGTNEVSVLKCPLPADGKDVTTFGYSPIKADTYGEHFYDKYDSLQFGTYANKGTGKTYGTLLIMGDYNSFKAFLKENDEEVMKAIAKKYDATVENSNNTVKQGDAVTFKYNSGNNKITVKKVAQNKKMWENENNLQYAIRLYKLVGGRTYTTAGYSYNATDKYNFSAEVQSIVNPF